MCSLAPMPSPRADPSAEVEKDIKTDSNKVKKTFEEKKAEIKEVVKKHKEKLTTSTRARARQE